MISMRKFFEDSNNYFNMSDQMNISGIKDEENQVYQ